MYNLERREKNYKKEYININFWLTPSIFQRFTTEGIILNTQ